MTSAEEEMRELARLGKVSYADWAGYAWKNELNMRRKHVLNYFAELLGDVETDHNPHHQLECAFGVAAFCMRRLIECRLLTDKFCCTKRTIYEIPTSDEGQHSFRQSFLRSTGAHFFSNYTMSKRVRTELTPKKISDRFLHAQTLAALSGSEYIPDGILVASDHQQSVSLFHITANEYSELVDAFLGDFVRLEQDLIDPDTGRVSAIRE